VEQPGPDELPAVAWCRRSAWCGSISRRCWCEHPQETGAQRRLGKEDSHDTDTWKSTRRRLRLAVAGAVVLTALTATAAASASLPPERGASAVRRAAGARSPFPGFVLDRGRYRTIEASDLACGSPLRHQRRRPDHRRARQGRPRWHPDSESGFLRDARGRTVVVDVPGAKGTEAIKLNNRGQIAGSYGAAWRRRPRRRRASTATGGRR
jgi:hypothetical protein